MAELTYRADVDGLRAVAVLVVVLFHAGTGLTGGYVGVDIFFVISGFLITSLIARDLQAGTFSMTDFWGRRARRIAPAMVVMVASTFIAGAFLLLPDDFKELGQSVVAQATLLANVYFYREAGYFAGPSELKPLLHTWSLAVEEQFYLLMPTILLLLHRKSRRLLVPVLFAAMLASLAWSVYAVAHSPDAAFFLLPSRAWELLIGALIALGQYRIQLGRAAAELLGWTGMGCILFSVVYFDKNTPFPGFAALVPCLGTAAVIVANMQWATTLRRLLSIRPVVFVGLVSYSFYLWHWPVLAFANYLAVEEVPASYRLALVLGSFLLAVASWKWVETPFRRMTVCPSRPAMFRFTAVTLVSLATLGVTVHWNAGFRNRFPDSVLQYADGRRDRNPRSSDLFNLPQSTLEQRGPPRLGDPGDRRPPVLLVIGDSHGDALMPVIEELCLDLDLPAVGVGKAATIPLLGAYSSQADAEKWRFHEYLRGYISRQSSIRHVMLIGRWTAYDDDLMNARNVMETVDFLAAKGVRTWIVRQVPEPGVDVPRALALALARGHSIDQVGTSYEQFVRERQSETAVFDELGGNSVAIIDPLDWFFQGRAVGRVAAGGRVVYFDSNHLSRHGALQLMPVLSPAFMDMSQDRNRGI